MVAHSPDNLHPFTLFHAVAVSTPGQNLTVPPVENLTGRRGDEPQFVAAS